MHISSMIPYLLWIHVLGQKRKSLLGTEVEFPGTPSSAIRLSMNLNHGDSPPSTKTAKEIFNCITLPTFTHLTLVPDQEEEVIEL